MLCLSLPNVTVSTLMRQNLDFDLHVYVTKTYRLPTSWLLGEQDEVTASREACVPTGTDK